MFINSEEVMKMESGKERFEYAKQMINTAKEDAAAVARIKLTGSEESAPRKVTPLRGLSLNAIADDIGVDPGRFTKVIRGIKKFTLQPDQLDLFCHKYLLCSVHELYFGEEPQTRLSKELSYAYHAFEKHGRNLKTQALEVLEKVFEEADNDNRLIDSDSCHNIARERLLTYVNDRSITPASLLPIAEPSLVRMHIKYFLEGDQPTLYTNTILYLCILLGLTADYMFDKVYSDVGTVFLFDDESKTPITDKDYLAFVAKYDQLRAADKAKAMAPIFQKEWVNW